MEKSKSTRRMTKPCKYCGVDFSLPCCRDKRDNFCSRGCGDLWRAKEKGKRKRECEICGTDFYPRQAQLDAGKGKFCSNICSVKYVATFRTAATYEKRSITFKKRIASGEIHIKSGADHPLWTGGQRVAARRRIESGKANEYTRKFRAANPEKMREWNHRRGQIRVGRLPRGTIKKLYDLQRGKCPICKAQIADKFHADHIIPISKGGRHEPLNIQLLCPTCNVRKSAKHPVDFMQERGFLL